MCPRTLYSLWGWCSRRTGQNHHERSLRGSLWLWRLWRAPCGRRLACAFASVHSAAQHASAACPLEQRTSEAFNIFDVLLLSKVLSMIFLNTSMTNSLKGTTQSMTDDRDELCIIEEKKMCILNYRFPNLTLFNAQIIDVNDLRLILPSRISNISSK